MKRYNILYKRPEIAPDEAKEMADFDQLIVAHQSGAGNDSKIWRITGSFIVFLTLIGLVFNSINRDTFESDVPEQVRANEAAPIIEEPQRMDQTPIIAENHDGSDDKATSNEEVIPNAAIKSQSPKEPEAAGKNNEASGFIEASPVDGFPHLYQYFDDHLAYPPEILDDGVEGNVIVKFVIDTDGLPDNIIIEKSLHKTLDSTAMALIQQMPEWKPATLDGRAIPSTHRIPLFFQIDKTEE